MFSQLPPTDTQSIKDKKLKKKKVDRVNFVHERPNPDSLDHLD